MKDKVSGVKDAITGTTSDAVHATSDALPDGEQIGKLKDTAERNPLGLVIGGVAVGFVAGLLLPSTRLEDRQMGEMSDRVIDAAKETASDALESGKQVAHDAADTRQGAGARARVEPPGAGARVSRRLPDRLSNGGGLCLG